MLARLRGFALATAAATETVEGTPSTLSAASLSSSSRSFIITRLLLFLLSNQLVSLNESVLLSF
jgi:hypothetical protein